MSKQYTVDKTPIIRHSRSRFDLSHGIKTSANVGSLVPFDVQEVYPGDTFKINTSVVSRLSSQFIRPVMDNLFLDVFYFFVPSRLLYDKFVNVMGENTESAWANTVEYEVPTFNGTIPEKTVGDYMGLPTKVDLEEINVMPFRAFAKVYDEWFRDENVVAPMHINYGEINSAEVPNSGAWSPANYMGALPKVAKFHDYFTSGLPAPQKGQSVPVALANFADVPVTTFTQSTVSGSMPPLSLKTSSGSLPDIGVLGLTSNGGSNSRSFTVSTDTTFPFSSNSGVYPSNLLAKTSTLSVDPITVNDLRFAFQYQKLLERDARSGTRYTEMITAHWNVFNPDARLQRSEFLGGRRSPLSIHQVTQTTGGKTDSSGNTDISLGEVGAYSLSNSRSRFTKGFTEYGYVIGVFCIRQFHTYQQGVEKFWYRSKRTSFYDPVFSNIGEQPIYTKELYAGVTNKEQVFAYQEAWADLRKRQNRVTGQMRSNATDSLDVWHFADVYANAPTLTPTFIEETPTYVDRAITVESSVMDQFILDIYVQNIAYRVMPTYSVPSLIDHN